MLRPSLLLDFANTRRLDPRITFTRASVGTYFDRNGVLRTAGINEPRFDYDPITGYCKGLLIDEARTNLLLWSQDLSKSPTWTLTGCSVLTGIAGAPDGTASVFRIVEDTSNGDHTPYQVVSGLTAGSAYTYSVFRRAGTRTSVQVVMQQGGNNVAALVDLTNGTYSVSTAGGAWTGNTVSVIAMGGSWYRIAVSAAIVGSTSVSVRTKLVGAGSSSYAGDGASYLDAFCDQLEPGSFATSPIPTLGSAVTRSADIASITGSSFSSWYRQDEGTFVVTADTYINNPVAPRQTILLNNSAQPMGNMSVKIGRPSGYTGLTVVDDAGAVSADLAGSMYSANGMATVAACYKTNDFAMSDRGAAVMTDTSGNLPGSINTMYLGTDGGGAIFQNGHIARIAYYPKRLSNAELMGLSR